MSESFDELFRKAHEGTKIIYITGNHDERVRDLSFFNRMRYAHRLHIQIKNRVIHRLADGRDFLVLHGDQFDRAILRGRVSRWSDRIYDILTNRKGPTIDVEGTTKRFSLSKFLSYHGQIALNLLNNFERALCREARRSDVEGIICGHTHIAAFKKIGAVTYANCGSWLKDNKTAITESMDGTLCLLEWTHEQKPHGQPSLPFYNGDLLPVTITPDSYRFRPLTDRLTATIRRAWPSPHDASEGKRQKTVFSSRLCLNSYR